MTGATRRVGFEVQGRQWAYTDVVARPRAIRPRHSVENQWDILAPVLPGLAPPSPVTDPVTMVHAPEADASVDAWMGREGLSPADALVVIHVSAGNAFRRWPLHSFVALADRLSVAGPNRRIILTSGPSEAAAAAEVVRLVRERRPSAPQAVRTCGDMSLDELHALIGRARLYIGGDSGPLHIAATTRTPIVGLYGPTMPVRSAPWRDPELFHAAVDVGALPCRPCEQRVCEPGDFRCLTHITVDAVIAAAERALALPAPAGRAD
jgi:ADP-heptose:LPS heptosyltransferase